MAQYNNSTYKERRLPSWPGQFEVDRQTYKAIFFSNQMGSFFMVVQNFYCVHFDHGCTKFVLEVKEFKEFNGQSQSWWSNPIKRLNNKKNNLPILEYMNRYYIF